MSGKVFVALDVGLKERAIALIREITMLDQMMPGEPVIAGFKVNSLYTQEGPGLIKELRAVAPDYHYWVDLKFHDVPRTVARHIKALPDGVDFATIHAAGGPKMIEAAKKVADLRNLQLLGITVLTSISDTSWDHFAHCSVKDSVQSLATRAFISGIGVVCSPLEVATLAGIRGATTGRNADRLPVPIVTPGVRFLDQDVEDQMRVSTPKDAIANGADYVVMGSAFTNCQNHVEIEGVLKRLR
jgi:orotidine-5'-phosphate decarboxylase